MLLVKKPEKITDSLDEVGNTTAAIGKGFAIGAAALAALAIITAFVQEVNHSRQVPIQLLLTDTNVLIGLFIGGMIPFLVGSLTITAVGDAAYSMINEIRRQFREIPGLLEGTGKPDNQKCRNSNWCCFEEDGHARCNSSFFTCYCWIFIRTRNARRSSWWWPC